MWIVVGTEKGQVKLVSKKEYNKIIPKGSFLTVEDGDKKFILRVDDSTQHEPYSPNPIIVDMDLSALQPDQKCQNVVTAFRLLDIPEGEQGDIDFIRPQLLARKSTQEEIDLALEASKNGPYVFLATLYQGKNQKLVDTSGNIITTKMPLDMFYHQILICGTVGSGKTVAAKYLAQYFVEELPERGAVLAINVKDVDLLKMDQPSKTNNQSIINEWKSLGKEAHGIKDFMVYYPSNNILPQDKGISMDKCREITLDVKSIDPEALSGVIQGISDIGARHLPDIFRFWRERHIRNINDATFAQFVEYFGRARNLNYEFQILNVRGDDPQPIRLTWNTFDNVHRNLISSLQFFDNSRAITIDAMDILQRGKMSVIDVTGENGIQFGSIILRHLLKNIVETKLRNNITIPILIIIDEVHSFYDNTSSKEALDELDKICRTGRSQKIGMIFSSQNPNDIPPGLSSVINTKIFFKSEVAQARVHGITVSAEEMLSLKKGYALVSIHELSNVKVIKFPLSYCGVED